jgi:hypothetical protein
MELFDDFKPAPGSPLDFHINGKISVREEAGKVEVKYGFFPLAKFTRGDWAETYQAAVTLAEDYQIPYVIVAKICELDRNTVSKLVKTKRLLGLRYLFENDKGPAAPWKVVDEIVALIDQAVKDEPAITNAKIVTLLEQAGHAISETSVRKVRHRHHSSLTESPVPIAERKTTLQEKNRVAERLAQREWLIHQMQLFQAEIPETVTQIDPFDYDKGYVDLTPAQKRYLKTLRVGMPCQYAGGLLYSAILARFNFRQIVQQVFADCLSPSQRGYPLEVIFLTLFFSIVFHFPSLEALKKAKPLDWGVLLGRRRLPNRKVIHKFLNALTTFNRASKLMKDFAAMFVKEQIVEVGILFFDEHFLPYYGIERIHQGFFSTRRMVLEGNYQFWAHDMNGRPFFVITTDSHLHLRDMIPEMIRRVKEISGRDNMIIVFDRGGYSIELFELIALENAIFVTWAKYVPEKTLTEIKDEDYHEFVFEHHGHRDTYKLYSIERTIKEGRTKANQHRELKQMTVRMIVVWRLSTGQKTPLYTNDRESPMEKVAEPMTRRWSEQENIFQKMMRRYNLNYHPGYYIDELAKQPLVRNPKIQTMKEEIKELEDRIARQKQQIATRLLHLKNKNVSVEAYEQRQRKTLPKLHALEQQLATLQQQLQALPEQVSMIEALAGGKLSACDLEKKKIYDVIQIVAYNAEQGLLEIFQKYYHDQRDVEQILDMLVNYGGYVKLYNNTLYVMINYIDQPAYRRAAVELCKELNAMALKTLDHFQFPLFFKVITQPQPAAAC